MANPGFVYFPCGSWMEGPPAGVMSSGGSVAATLTAGARRYSIAADWHRGRIGRARASVEYVERSGALPGLSEVTSAPSGSLRGVQAWQGETLRAESAGQSWSSLRLSWTKASAGAGAVVADDCAELQEVQLPFGCFAASRRLQGGEAEAVLGVCDAASAGGSGVRIMVWRHDRDGRPVWLSLSSLVPPARME